MYQTIKTGLKSMSLNEADRRKMDKATNFSRFCSHFTRMGCYGEGEKAFLDCMRRCNNNDFNTFCTVQDRYLSDAINIDSL